MKFEKEHILNNKRHLIGPRIGGVYFLIFNEKIVYIGASSNMFYRIQDHRKNVKFKFNYYSTIEVDNHMNRLNLEKYYINKFRPKFNLYKHPDYDKKEVMKKILED